MTNWTQALDLAKKDQQNFIDRGKKIVKRYRDERGSGNGSSKGKRYNILWSNVKTIFPAVYAKKPRAQVERRYKDADPIARCASEILERALQYEIDHYSDYDAALKGAVLDRLLPGRGVAWVRFEGGDQITDDAVPPKDAPAPTAAVAPAEPADPGEYECTPTDYVYWEDFRHSPARTWEEVTWVSRRVYMGKAELEKRFPDAKDVPMMHEPIGIDKDTPGGDELNKAQVWEIWDKSTKTVVWRADGYPTDLDEKADPLGLDGFFPCPKPLFATMTTDTLVPVADYLEYQDQALELDELTQRIGMLVKAVKVVGVYDSSQTGIKRMLEEGVDNTLIPVDTWAAMAEKGGIKGTVDFLPLEMVVGALNQLYIARNECKQVIYEVTGLSDIIRGSSQAQETATAQRIKSQFGSMRLKETQGDVARFATDLLNIKAQIMSDLYRPETLREMSGIDLTEDAQYADQAIQLLKSESMRNYRIEIATDSMVEMDEEAEKQGRVEFLTAAGGFLKQAVEAAQMAPDLAPLMGEMLMFGVRAFKAGRPLEAAFEQFVAKTTEQQQQPKADPEAAKAQAAQQQAQIKAQSDQAIAQARTQADVQIAAARAQAQQQTDAMRQQMEERQHQSELEMKARMDQMQAVFDAQQQQRDEAFARWKAELESATKIETANIASKAKVDNAATQTATNEIAREVKP